MDYIISAFIYLGVYAVTLLFTYKAEVLLNRQSESTYSKGMYHRITIKIPALYLFMAVLLPSLLAGVRADTVGTDVLTYAKQIMDEAGRAASFKQLNKIDTTYTELGFKFYAFLVSRVFRGTGIWLFFIHIFIMVFFVRGIYLFRNTASMWKAMAVFMFCHYHVSLNMIRQSMAMGVLFVAFYYLTKKRYLWYWMLILLAFSIHSFSILIGIILFVLWILREWYRSRSQKLLVLFIMLLFVVGFQTILKYLPKIFTGALYRYYRYFATTAGVSAKDVLTSPSLIIYLAMLVMAIWVIEKNKGRDLTDSMLFITAILAVGFRYMQIFFSEIYRVGVYLLYPYAVYISESFGYKFKIGKRSRVYGFLMALILFWLCDCMLSGHSSTAIFKFRF